ncbi:uncharacterized protein BJX67DRAFT_339496 [Aspergillus lucknowensis]|uniref:Uncharacterized protein n=1 Tax=Aspergillus lucknowensis TaxID=176173 RepID=A0ABR4M785_9EURO
MRYLNSYLAFGLGVSFGALAKECTTTETGEEALLVTSPDQLDVFEGCTAISGDIVIDSSYSGDFILSGVTTFAGNISTDAEDPAQDLGSVELPDLVDLGTINLGSVVNAHLPKVEQAVDIVLVQASSSGEVDLGSLVEANNVRVQGSWTTINVASLKTVNQVAQFCGVSGCGIYPDTNPPFISVDLPALETTNHLEVAGTVESVSVPNLEVVGFQEPEIAYVQGLRINIQESEKDLDFDAPKLHTLNGTLEVYGGVSGLSLGALREGNVGVTLNARAPLNVYSTLRTTSHFYLWGTLESIELPNFVDLGSVSLAYEPRLPCNETLYRLWQLVPGSSDPNKCTEIEV